MKNSFAVKIFVVTVLALCTCIAFADVKSVFSKEMKISFTSSDTPEPNVKNISTDTRQKYKWGLIEVELNMEKGESKSGAYLDDVEMDVEVALLNGEKRNVQQVILFTGKIEYYSIELDGNKHKLLALIPGRLFARYANKKVSPAQAEMYIKVKLSSNNKPLATGYYSTKGSKPEKELKNWFNKFQNSKAISVKTVPNSVFARRDTPWFMIDHDKYELEKKAE